MLMISISMIEYIHFKEKGYPMFPFPEVLYPNDLAFMLREIYDRHDEAGGSNWSSILAKGEMDMIFP